MSSNTSTGVPLQLSIQKNGKLNLREEITLDKKILSRILQIIIIISLLIISYYFIWDEQLEKVLAFFCMVIVITLLVYYFFNKISMRDRKGE
jgi:amino acid permease